MFTKLGPISNQSPAGSKVAFEKRPVPYVKRARTTVAAADRASLSKAIKPQHATRPFTIKRLQQMFPELSLSTIKSMLQ